MEEKITFSNSREQLLAGVISRPEGKGPFPAIIVCHGFTDTKDVHFHARLQNTLADSGTAVLRFDFTGNGESEGKISEGDVMQEAEDVKKAIDYLYRQDFVDRERIGLCGHGMGGIVSMIAPAQDSRIKAVALISPSIQFDSLVISSFGDLLPDLKSKGYLMYNKIHSDGIVRVHKLTREFFDAWKGIDANGSIKKVKQPVLMVFGTNEGPSSTPEAVQELFANANEPKYIEIIEGADHNYTDRACEAKMTGHVTEFFRRYLG